MADQYPTSQITNVVAELDTALGHLESALADAGQSVTVLRRNIGQLANVADVMHEMEAAMERARRSLDLSAIAMGEPVAKPPLRPVPAQETMQPYQAAAPVAQPAPAYTEPAPAYAEPAPAYAEPAPEPIADFESDVTAEAEPALETESEQAYAEAPAETMAEEPAAEAGEIQAVSHCLRLGVASKAGSLDLKAVDGSVNENPAVVDVALLDYDGRKATLKLWINGQADPIGVRDALLGSLRRRLGDERDAEVLIEFEGAA